MTRFVSFLFFGLVSINAGEAKLPDGQECPVEAYVVSKAKRFGAETTTVEFRSNTSECPCAAKKCLSLCCPMGSVATHREQPGCTAMENTSSLLEFPPYEDPWSGSTGQLRIDNFHVFTWNPCQAGDMFELSPEDDVDYEYKLLANGSIYLPRGDRSVGFANYCFVAVENETVYHVMLCGFDNIVDTLPTPSPIIIGLYRTADVLSTICYLATFTFYYVLPELRNTHGATVRGYVGTMFVANFADILTWLMPKRNVGQALCIVFAGMAKYFSLAGFFWLNVMCFDIWRTFGRLKMLQINARHQKQNKLTIYSAYAWGTSALITVISVLMDYVPDVSKSFITEKYSVGMCWYTSLPAYIIYYCAPIAMMGFCNICFFLSTATKLMLHRKDVAIQLNGTDSRRHEDNKQEFNIYVKLFIIMGTNWSVDLLSWICNYTPAYLWVAMDVFDSLQGVIVFVAFVWKGKVRRLLFQRLRYRNRSTTSTSNGAVSKAAPRENSISNTKRTKSTGERGSMTDPEQQAECSRIQGSENT